MGVEFRKNFIVGRTASFEQLKEGVSRASLLAVVQDYQGS
jgi:NADPH-dependent glutamate synthase beta subunit-like oxidoreductase